MTVNLKGRSFLTLMDFAPEEIRYLIDLSHELKAKKKSGEIGHLLEGKTICLMFEKTSTRTRSSFEVAMNDEGGNAVFLGPHDSQVGKKESIEDSAKVLGRIFDGINPLFRQFIVDFGEKQFLEFPNDLLTFRGGRRIHRTSSAYSFAGSVAMSTPRYSTIAFFASSMALLKAFTLESMYA